jgi:RNA polymerase sigma-70 factor (ECF subfamily)
MSTIEFHNHFNQLSTVLRSFAYSLTQNREDANDLFQETAYRAVKNKDKFGEGTNLKAWLFTIMKNIFINNYRKKLKNNTFLDSTENNYFLNSATINVPNTGESNMMIEELTNMIDTLDESLKVPFLMHYQGYKYHEISDHMDLPLGTVKSRIFFARKELKSLISKRYQNIRG